MVDTYDLIGAATSVASMRSLLPDWTFEEVAARRSGDENGPGTHQGLKIMRVPFGDSRLDILVRAHELAHVAVTPRHENWSGIILPSLTNDDVAPAEEGRVNHLVGQVFDNRFFYDGDEINLTVKALATGSIRTLIHQTTILGFTGAGDALREVVYRVDRDAYDTLSTWIEEMVWIWRGCGDRLATPAGFRASSDVAFAERRFI